ncbi:Transcriptional regulator TetR family [Patulibacter medicamentivorans]|uniref:Transcriptional regulator TetR family n=1 Tax=Patulibacter medicamentivorans TaxID=1097667 RepID=H0E0K2_9ACTN|nr:TetR/AcrR family transcriptional regulator [Patulibacter medicamentivorans]EHN12736.1 Transcriptional regulator TetR family [Patulibacter medicamentivorans]
MASAPQAGPRRRLTKQARRALILKAAEAVFGEVGYHGATMELVAVRSGVTRSLLYEHFSSLDDLYVACVHAARAELHSRFVDASIFNQGHPRDQLRAGIEAYFRFVQEHGPSWDVLSGTGSLPAGPAGELAAELRFRAADQIAALAEKVVPDLDPDEVRAYAHIVSGGGEQLARWWRRNPGVPLDDVVERLMTVVWDGLSGFVDSAVEQGTSSAG